MSERLRQLNEQVSALERAKMAAGAQNTSEGRGSHEESMLIALKIEQKKLGLVAMQRRARALTLHFACPPALRLPDSSSDPSALKADLPPVDLSSILQGFACWSISDAFFSSDYQVQLFAAHALDNVPNVELSALPETRLSVCPILAACCVPCSRALLDSILWRSHLTICSACLHMQTAVPMSVKSHTPVNLRYYDSKKRSFLDELFRHGERFFQFHQKRKEREKVS